MSALLRLATASLLARRRTTGLMLLALTLSCALLFGVEKLRSELRTSAYAAVGAVDLIVGARTAPEQLLLATVFHYGALSTPLPRSTEARLAAHPAVRFALPLSLGDSVAGLPVVGTVPAYFAHLGTPPEGALAFQAGAPFTSDEEVVLGAEAARRLGKDLGDPLTLSHGLGAQSFLEHGDHPLQVVGILAPTGTPLDQRVLVSLEALHAAHDGVASGAPEEENISALLLGLAPRAAALGLAAQLNRSEDPPLTAALPALTLAGLLRWLGAGEAVLRVLSIFVMVVALTGMLAMMLASLEQRRREMAVLRALGAGFGTLLALLLAEALILTFLAIGLGLGLVHGGLALAAPALQSATGLALQDLGPTPGEGLLVLGALALATLAGLLPAWLAARRALMDGLSPQG
ncbi:MAG: ABC transporter permease [Gammaproteobacteria bacterium]|nr:ABC transporter permease [Gammaproteobacteria bacterium]